MIFSRRSRAGRHAKPEEALPEEIELSEQPAAPPASERASGPYDIAEAPRGVQRVDLGSLLIPAVDGVEIRAQAAENGQIQQLELSYGPNALQLGVFAAPRTDSLWDEVRPEILSALRDDGVQAEQLAGRWGVELRARVNTTQGVDDLRFVGIDGPRWMVRAVFRGPAAADPAQGGPLHQCLTGLVVNRDEVARPTREALPLRLPQEVPTAQDQGGPATDAAGNAAEGKAAEGKSRPSPPPRRN